MNKKINEVGSHNSEPLSGNLFENIPDSLPEEYFEHLVHSESLTIERIVSRGHVTPEGDWYDQERHEWVLVLQGAAMLTFEDGRQVQLGRGDFLNIPAHQKHRVSWTDPDCETLWLAVHY
ncbi:cupin domain-containing protein [Pleionea sp. CnH1-48]|uniref:cupin domain-containing protein n=1 Tax=Pleionea sp. CnH1-48 TaxID=2954494 RepID=UPI002097A82F|nr:cupin domain-containing protein [Pleionea sp. CnH1-48]